MNVTRTNQCCIPYGNTFHGEPLNVRGLCKSKKYKLGVLFPFLFNRGINDETGESLVSQSLIPLTFQRLCSAICLSLILVLIDPPLATASNSVTATKDCTTTPTVTLAQFTIATPQVIQWSAVYNPVSGCNGTEFWLSTVGPNMADIPLTTAGGLGGSQYLMAGTYHISIKTLYMGQGAYTVTYNLTASISVNPTSFNFGSITAGGAPVQSPPFTIARSGDLDVTIGTLTSSDPSHFTIISSPAGQIVGSSKTFKVQFDPGSTPGPFSATITIPGTSPGGPTVSPVTISVSGTTLPKIPKITCSGGNCGGGPILGSADGDVAEQKTFNFGFQNAGTAPLVISSISLINNSPGATFSFASPPSTTPVPPGMSQTVQIKFSPPPGEATYCGNLVIQSNDPNTPTKQCYFQAVGHHPVPKMRVQADLLDYHQVELGFSFTKAIVVYNDGDAPLQITVSDISTGNPLFAPNLKHWSTLETGGPVLVSPGSTPHIFKETYTPLSVGSHVIRLRVDGNDLSNPTRDITLQGQGITPIPIDSVLVLDRSGSMADSAGPRRKIDALQTAADMFVHLLRPTTGPDKIDKIGLVRFNKDNDVYLPLDFKT